MQFDHYIIRPLTTEDLLPYFDMVDRNRKRLEDFFVGTVSRTQNLEDTRDFLADVTARAEAKTYFPYLIIDQHNNRFAGFLDLKNIDWSIPKAEIGCYMDSDYEGKGVAAKAFQLFCGYSFATFGFKKLFLRTHESNKAVIRVAENTGFEKEGTLRYEYKTSRGELIDLIYYGRLN